MDNEGFYGGVRLLMAMCDIFYKYCKRNSIELHQGNFTLSYDTNIPRQVKYVPFDIVVVNIHRCMTVCLVPSAEICG